MDHCLESTSRVEVAKTKAARTIFVRGVPEQLWLRLHWNALARRTSIQQLVIDSLNTDPDLQQIGQYQDTQLD
jgi:hypothetical protein